ncbi:transcriptional-regulating factor 1 isoform X2 [Anolis sagrei]|uniref:transcriptional-regulating factor 1 isoform X2 n=1 Tax=Anolis sagrei TaxID=38937 RepID=UPI0035212344
MGDQQMYKTNRVVNNNENFYYQQQQQQQHLNSLTPLNHSYETPTMDSSQDSPLSPSFPHDTNVGSKSLGLLDSPRQAGWSHLGSGNHLPLKNNQNVMWSSAAQSEPMDGYDHLCSQANEVRSQKMHKLDSFAQAFNNQNLRIQVNNVSQIIQPSGMENAGDSALRQLLSQKPSVEMQPVQRYQQLPQQIHQGFASAQQKQQMLLMQHQQPLYYENQQHLAHLQMHSAMHQGQAHLQQMHSQHLLPQQLHQDQYYLQQQSPHQGQHRLLMHEMQQQQRQCPVQTTQYYPAQPMMQQLQQTQQMQMQLPPSHRDPDQRPLHDTHHYSQDRGHSVQLIQLGSVPQYFSQDPQQQFRHLYPQNLLQQQPAGDVGQPNHFQNDNKTQALMDSHLGLPGAEGAEHPPQQDITSGNSSIPHQPLISPANVNMNNRGSQQLSPNTVWAQMQLSDSRHQSVSPEQSSSGHDKETYIERSEAKSKLACSVCLKEFKSLPALNGHMRSHGGMHASPIFRQEEGKIVPEQQQQQQQQEQLPSEAESFMPIVMPVSVPVKLLSPEANMQAAEGGAALRDKPVSDDEMPVLVRMTYSPPHSPKAVSPCVSSDLSEKHNESTHNSESFRSFQDKKKHRHRPEPLFIPPPSFNLSVCHSGATLYQSQLRSPRVLGDHLLDRIHDPPPYTPPPMLSPVRQGSGLFSSVIASSLGTSQPQLPLTPLTPTPRVLLCRSNSIDGDKVPVIPGPGEQTIDIEPRINIGSRFQADIPELKDRALLRKENHKAILVWKPCLQLEDKDFQQKVTNLLNMCCSSVLTGGGTNLEYGLHSLFEAKGDIMVAVEMLLLLKPRRTKSHPLANYHYAGSDQWTPAEKKLFNKALSTYSKDFILVQKMVKSKTVAQCVEYYYTWKKILHLVRKHRTRLAEIKDEHLTSEEEELEEEEQPEEDRKSVKEEEVEIRIDPPPIVASAPINLPSLQSIMLPVTSFSCEMPDCGAMFSSRQALNGHVRIHSSTNPAAKSRSGGGGTKQKPTPQNNDYCSLKSSPAHSTTSGETEPPTVFPCKECGKMFFKIKSRNAHMKTHRQQEEQQRQKAQKASVAAEMAATIARTTGPAGHDLISLDHLDLIKQVEQVDLGSDVVQELGAVIDGAEAIDPVLLLEEDDTELLQDDVEL